MSSRVCVECAGQTQAVCGVDNVFELLLPQPSTSAPVGTITIGGVDTALTFSGQEPIAISSMVAGRRALVLQGVPTLQLAGRNGLAWVVTDSICWPCRVQAVSLLGETQAQVTLADALPAALPSGVTASLYFGYWAAILPSRSTPIGGCLIRVTYEPVARIGQPEATLTYLVAYVHQIFDTGLTAPQLRAYFGGSPAAPSDDAGLEPAIAAGLDDLVRELRVRLAERHLTEQDIPAPSALLPAHRLFAAAHMYALTDRDKHDSLRAEARYAVDDTLRHLWIDVDGSGTPTPPDTLNITGLRSRDFAFKLPRKRHHYPRGAW